MSAVNSAPSPPRKRLLRPHRFVRPVLATVVVLALVAAPVWLLVVTSMKDVGEAAALGFGLPSDWKIAENYDTVLHEGQALEGFVNSVLVAVPAILLTTALACLAGWIFARATSRSVRSLYYFAIAGLLVPNSIITSIIWMARYDLSGSRWALIMYYVGSFLPFAIFLVAGFVKTIPAELEEAARIDGCGALGVFLRIVLPLLRPVTATLMVILLIFVWNDFFAALFLLTNPDHVTLPLGLFNFASSGLYSKNWNLIMADVVVTSLPLIVVYVVAQRWIVAGLTGGAVNR